MRQIREILRATHDVGLSHGWGLASLGPTEARLLLQVLDDRSDTRSTVIASQLPVDKWHGVVQDPTMADAILDRVVHGAYRITLRGESMRKIARQRRPQ